MNSWPDDLDVSATACISIKTVDLNDGSPATARVTNARRTCIQPMTAEKRFAQINGRLKFGFRRRLSRFFPREACIEGFFDLQSDVLQCLAIHRAIFPCTHRCLFVLL